MLALYRCGRQTDGTRGLYGGSFRAPPQDELALEPTPQLHPAAAANPQEHDPELVTAVHRRRPCEGALPSPTGQLIGRGGAASSPSCRQLASSATRCGFWY